MNSIGTLKMKQLSVGNSTGTQVEKREWRRDQDSSDRDNNPCASSFDDFVSCARENSRKNLKSYKKEFNDDEDMQHLDVGDNDDDDGKVGDLDDWDVKGSIGLDSTVDYEVIFALYFCDLLIYAYPCYS